jgi:hypothetical protein
MNTIFIFHVLSGFFLVCVVNQFEVAQKPETTEAPKGSRYTATDTAHLEPSVPPFYIAHHKTSTPTMTAQPHRDD